MNREELYELHRNLTGHALDLMYKKNIDYASEDDNPFGNLVGSVVVGVDPKRGVLVRCIDKFSRISSFIKNGELKVTDEGVQDSIIDVINYMVLLAGMIITEDREKNKNTAKPIEPNVPVSRGRNDEEF